MFFSGSRGERFLVIDAAGSTCPGFWIGELSFHPSNGTWQNVGRANEAKNLAGRSIGSAFPSENRILVSTIKTALFALGCPVQLIVETHSLRHTVPLHETGKFIHGNLR